MAETLVDASFKEAGNVAFQRLFGYISGDNRQKESIAMTAPVSQRQTNGKYNISFVMPSKYTMETIPEPLNPDVVLRQIPARKIAAIRYSGTWAPKRYEAKQDLLNEFISREGLTATDQATFARHDPPFQLPFLRRNEVLIPVE